MSWQNAFGGRRAALWAVPLAIVVANLVWLSAFGSGSRVRLRELDRRLEAANRAKADVTARLAGREKLWIEATENRARLEQLYRERFATERGRFTEQVRELKSLAERSGLDPATIAYPEEQFVDFGLVRRSFVFGVDGGYDSLRNFLHLLELSASFLTLEQISVAEGSGGLSVKLRLSTLFESVGSDAEAAEREGVAARTTPGATEEPAGAEAPPPEAPEDSSSAEDGR